MEQTLKQIADELGIDKQRVYRYVNGWLVACANQNNGGCILLCLYFEL